MYTCLVRNNIGAPLEKVTLLADLEFCKSVLQAMVKANAAVTTAEILEGSKLYSGDFRVKPIFTYKIIDQVLVESNR